MNNLILIWLDRGFVWKLVKVDEVFFLNIVICRYLSLFFGVNYVVKFCIVSLFYVVKFFCWFVKSLCNVFLLIRINMYLFDKLVKWEVLYKSG